MSEKEASAPAEQAPASPAPAKETSPAPAAEIEAPAANDETSPAAAADPDAAPATNGDANGNGNGNGHEDSEAPATSAPASKNATRTSSRTKQESSSKPAPKKATGKAAKPRASTGAAAGGSKKQASGSGGERNFSIGDIVLGRLKGYPAWPAKIVDPDQLPRAVLAQRPGKNPSTFCVQYFPVGDYSWLNIRDLTPLSESDIKAFLDQPGRKATGALREAYLIAQDPTEWEDGQAEMLAAKDAQAAEGEEEVDELEDDEADADAPAGGKRKKASGGVKEGSKKKAKTEKKDETASKKTKAAPKAKGAAKSKSAPESKPAVENQAPADDDPMSNDPECVKVKDWRHKLQRAFLGKSLPESDEMSTYDGLFKDIEEYEGMTIEALQYSKIGKVMKKIAAMSTIPKNEEYKITDRAQKLMNDWQEFIEKNSSEEKKDTNGAMEVDA